MPLVTRQYGPNAKNLKLSLIKKDDDIEGDFDEDGVEGADDVNLC